MMVNRKVLHLTGMTATKYGSMESYLLEIVRQSAIAGYDSVLQYERGPLPERFATDLKRANAKVIFAETAGRSVKSLASAMRTIIRERPEVVQFHFSERHVVALGALVARAAGAKRIVAMVHNVHRLTPRSLARLAFNRCDSVLGVSDAVVADLERGGVHMPLLHRHYLGLVAAPDTPNCEREEIRRRLAIPTGATVLGNIAFDAPFKGVDTLVKALPEVVKEFPTIQLVQLGVDPQASALPALAEELGVSDRIQWLGVRDYGATYLHAADIYVQPSRFGEGLPLAVMEAMALGLPSVVTRVAGNIEAVIDNLTGVTVEPDNPSALARGIIELITKRSAWPNLSLAARARFSSHFAGTTSVARLLSEYYGVPSSGA